MTEKFGADYFLRGQELGISGYTDYHWMPELTVLMAQAIAEHCGFMKSGTVLDFGCARGYTVRALRGLGHEAWGLDISQWAIDNCDPAVKQWVSCNYGFPVRATYDWVLAKDVLEHVEDAAYTIKTLMGAAQEGVFVVVPLSAMDGGKYVVPSYEDDVTHIHRLTLATWAAMFMVPGWSIDARYRLPGVKDNYNQYPNANGFITARRLE